LVARPDSAQAQAMAADAPQEADLVVGHGDLCAPNVLLTDARSSAGYVDVGKLGVADRAADLGCGIWSLEFNRIGHVVDEFLDAYGLSVDRAAVQWYRDFYEVA
jgi:aminoglycoside phosphotransferase